MLQIELPLQLVPFICPLIVIFFIGSVTNRPNGHVFAWPFLYLDDESLHTILLTGILSMK